MKKIYTLLLAVLITATGVLAQAPEKMSYQAVVRNTTNALVTNQTVGIQVSILQGSSSGSLVYVETQTPVTNINGLISIEIGTGTIVSGMFSSIDWSNGPYFVKTEIDPTGGTIYTINGSSQLLSVPYAIHANTADSIVGYNGTHTVDTDTQIDSTGIAALGFVAGPHTDSVEIANMGFSTGTIADAGIVGSDGGTGNGSNVDMLSITLDLTGMEGRWIHIFGGTAISEDINTSNTAIVRIIIDNNIASAQTICAQRQGSGAYSNSNWDGNSTNSFSVQGYFKVTSLFATSNVTIKLNGGIDTGNFHWGDQLNYTSFDGEGAGGHLGYAIF